MNRRKEPQAAFAEEVGGVVGGPGGRGFLTRLGQDTQDNIITET